MVFKYFSSTFQVYLDFIAANMIASFSLPGLCDISDENDEDIVGIKESVSEEIRLSTEDDPCFAHTIQLVVKYGLKDVGPLSKVLC